MQIKKSTVPYQLLYPISGGYVKEELLFLDIETTGLSAASSFVYLIGCAYYTDNQFHLIQWLCDSVTEEKELLTSFLTLAKNYRILLHYNGDAFDLRFLKSRCLHHSLPVDFLSMPSIDLYKKVLPFKKLLPVPNLKLKTMECLFHISRKDTLDGAELIDYYTRYVGLAALKEKLASSAEPHLDLPTKGHRLIGLDTFDTLLSAILLHNKEDVENLILLTSLLMLTDLSYGNFTVSNRQSLQTEELFTLTFPGSLPEGVRLSFMIPMKDSDLNLYLQLSSDTGTIRIPTQTTMLRFYFENYKDYYYLPMEDTAIHKSVGEFVDKAYRQNAKAETCYVKKEGTFLPQTKKIISPWFAQTHKDSLTWFERENPALNDPELVTRYLKHFFLTK